MTTEKDILAELDGHFYRMFFGSFGVKVVDLEGDEAVPMPETVNEAAVVKARPKFINWEEYDDKILEMRRAGAQYKEIARTLGLNKDSVRWRFQRLCEVMGVEPEIEGPSYKKFNPQIEAEIVALRDKGETFQAIGKRYGMSKASVCTLYYRWYRRTHREDAA